MEEEDFHSKAVSSLLNEHSDWINLPLIPAGHHLILLLAE